MSRSLLDFDTHSKHKVIAFNSNPFCPYKDSSSVRLTPTCTTGTGTAAASLHTVHGREQLQRLLSSGGYTTRRSYADKDSDQIKDFREREEQRELERDEADKTKAKITQSDAGGLAGGGGGPTAEEQQQQAEKEAKVDATRTKILDAALLHVPELGWSKQAIVLGAEECGYPSVVHGMFPEGGFALVSHFNGKCNAQLVQCLQQQTDNGQKEVEDPLEFLVQAVRQRLELIVPYKKHWPQAMALNAQPPHASTALAQVLTLVDDICYYSGDRSVDVSPTSLSIIHDTL